MVTPNLDVVPVFAVPFGHTRLEDCARLNDELEALFVARETDEFRNPTPSHVPQQELFESRFNLFTWPEPCIRQLRQFMLDSIARTVLQATSMTVEELQRRQMHNHTWFHVTKRGGSFVAHNHPLASWSAVYCVRPGAAAPGHPDNGVLRFFDTRPGAGAYRDPANDRLLPAFRFGHLEFRLEPGQCVVFPSFVYHEVATFHGDDRRITVATNCWFT